MKQFIAALAIAIPVMAAAQESNDTYKACVRDSMVIGLAAQFRDAGNSPQEAYMTLKTRFPQFVAKLPDDVLKGFINTVYFDPEASRIPSDQLRAMEDRHCADQLRGASRVFTPLN